MFTEHNASEPMILTEGYYRPLRYYANGALGGCGTPSGLSLILDLIVQSLPTALLEGLSDTRLTIQTKGGLLHLQFTFQVITVCGLMTGIMFQDRLAV